MARVAKLVERSGFKIRRPKGHAGSSPASGTIKSMNYFRSLFLFLFWIGAAIVCFISAYKAYQFFAYERMLEEDMYKLATENNCFYLGRPWGTHNIALFNCNNKVLANIIEPEPLKKLYPELEEKKGRK